MNRHLHLILPTACLAAVFFSLVCTPSQFVHCASVDTACRSAQAVQLAIKSPDPRVKILCLFDGVKSGFPDHWSMEHEIRSWADGIVDSDGAVIDIAAELTGMRGTLNAHALQNIALLFPDLQSLTLHGHNLEGDFDFSGFAKLGLTFTALDISRASKKGGAGFSGVFDTRFLPRSLREISIQFNSFRSPPSSEGFDWEPLSQLHNLKVLWLSDNYLASKHVLFEHLPRSLQKLSIRNNRFSGVADLTNLPPALVGVTLDGNAGVTFIGEPEFFPPLALDVGSKLRLHSISVTVGENHNVISGEEFLKLAAYRERAAEAGDGEQRRPAVEEESDDDF